MCGSMQPRYCVSAQVSKILFADQVPRPPTKGSCPTESSVEGGEGFPS